MDVIDPSLLEILRNKTGLPIEDPYQYQNVLDSLKTKARKIYHFLSIFALKIFWINYINSV